MEEDFTWISQAIVLLREMLPRCIETCHSWHRFKSINGDLDYFKDSEVYTHLIRDIDKKFRELTGVEEKIRQLGKTCRTQAEDVSISYHRTNSIN